MENPIEPIKEESYEKIKAEAKAFYRTLERIWCPAVDDYVVFNKAGFGHLVRKGSIMRPKSEQKRRFALLSHIARILKDPGTIAAHEENTILHTVKISVFAGKQKSTP